MSRPSSKDEISEETLRGFKYLKNFFPLLQKYHPIRSHHNRQLHFDQYLALILCYFFNPVITSLRGINQAASLNKVQKLLGVKTKGLATLSEAAQVFDADLLHPLIKQLAQQALPFEKNPKLKKLQQTLVAVDGSLLPALPKMLWALWLNDQNRAAKLHLAFDVEKGIPLDASVTTANGNEKRVLADRFLCPGHLYVLDAGYAEYKLLYNIKQASSSFVIRIRDNAVWQTIEEKQLSKDDKNAGVIMDVVAHLGCSNKQADYPEPIRIIKIFHRGNETVQRKSRVSSKKSFRTTEVDYTFLLVTDRFDLPAETIALIYRYRWQVELFFRWFKCILGCRHLLAHSKNGVTLQIYCALIASMLITLRTGRKPTKRTFEMLCFYFLGWATEEELEEHINKLKDAEKKTVA